MFICDKRNVQDKTPSLHQMSMGCFWLQNRFVSLPLAGGQERLCDGEW